VPAGGGPTGGAPCLGVGLEGAVAVHDGGICGVCTHGL
jgi:hypothetical protein